MYGAVAHFRVKPGNDPRKIEAIAQKYAVPGQVAVYLYQMDRDPLEYYMAVVFESKDAFRADSDDTQKRSVAMAFLEILAAPPQWYDGKIMPLT